MSHSHWREVNEALDAALELTSAERAAFVLHLREVDPAVGQEVARLLEACAAAELAPDFLQDRATAFASPVIDDLDRQSRHADGELAPAVAEALHGQFTLEGEIARGGMATLFLASANGDGSRVAVKVFHRSVTREIGSARFRQEIAIVSAIRHRRILPLITAGSRGDLVYFVMPFLEDGSLRDRLEREGSLSIEAALAIARDVAEALDHAHAQGIVHRDVKPENILLAGNTAFVADFGLAWMMERDVPARLTASGITVGTPPYMSPEQASAGSRVDGRADIYALACVVYEMLAGEPPFTGPNRHAILARHALAPVPSLYIVRPTISPAFQQAIERALAKVPADRYASAREFVRDLERSCDRASAARRNAWAKVAGGLAALLVVGSVALQGGADVEGISTNTARQRADTTRIVIFPVDDPAWRSTQPPHRQVQEAVGEWEGVTVVDEAAVAEALGDSRARKLSRREAREIALGLGAGRYIRQNIGATPDFIRLSLAFYDAPTDSLLIERAVKLPRDLRAADDSIRAIARHVLLRGGFARMQGRAITTSLPAAQSYASGLEAVDDWNLRDADSAFLAAVEYDPSLTYSHLWLAQVRAWNGEVPARWRAFAERALFDTLRLEPRDRNRSRALAARARGNHDRSRAIWESLVDDDPRDFTAWYGLATCIKADDVVIADRGSPSGWRFRSSYHRAIEAYRQAFELNPAIHRGFGSHSFRDVRRLFFTSRTLVRPGRLRTSDTTAFFAYPSWDADSLVLVPYTLQAVRDGLPFRQSSAIDEAVKQQRRVFHEVTTSWAASPSRSSTAIEALAVALELVGDPTALDTLRRSRMLAETEVERRRIGAQEVWLQVKFALPSDLRSLRAARLLADSMLAGAGRAPDPSNLYLATLATLTGRASLASDLIRMGPDVVQGPAAVTRPGLAALIYASLGGPTDTLLALEQEVVLAIDRSATAPTRSSLGLEWLARPATLAFPEYRSPSILQLEGHGDGLLDAQAAMMRGDSGVARLTLAELKRRRARLHPADLMLDALYPEARLVEVLEGPHAAIDWIDPTLRMIRSTAPQEFNDPARAGALIRTLAFRSELAIATGDSVAARRWAASVTVLLSGADQFMQPLVQRMSSLSP